MQFVLQNHPAVIISKIQLDAQIRRKQIEELWAAPDMLTRIRLICKYYPDLFNREKNKVLNNEMVAYLIRGKREMISRIRKRHPELLLNKKNR